MISYVVSLNLDRDTNCARTESQMSYYVNVVLRTYVVCTYVRTYVPITYVNVVLRKCRKRRVRNGSMDGVWFFF